MNYTSEIVARQKLNFESTCTYMVDEKREECRHIRKRPSPNLFDYRWYARIHSLLSDFVVMESALAWLNTLGGAYSALGEHSNYHAKVAHDIAIKQLAIADKLDDPKLKTQCKLYIAFGLLQQRKYKTAQLIIEEQMRSSNVTGNRAENKLYQMCLAAMQRLKIGKERKNQSNENTRH